MKKVNACPECENLLSVKAKRCVCGWVLIEKIKPLNADHRCQYVILGRRCPLPGGICPFPYSKEGPWYCSGHWRVFDDPRRGEAVLMDAEKNFHEIMERLKDWRETFRNTKFKI